MHFTTIASIAIALVATGLTASATPSANHYQHLEVFPARSHGRRISRKMHLAPRHERHGTTTVTEYTTLTSYSGAVPTATDSDCAAPTTVTEYTTITVTETPSSSEEPAPESTEAPSSTSAEEPAPSSSSAPPSASGAVIVATGSQCGDPNGVPDPSATSGPNGDENWLNCGVDGEGWVPPPITLENLVYKDLATVLQQEHNPFTACAPYLDIFERMSAETGVPTIFLASIALQESGCNPSVTGGATEIGMMQITPEKCPAEGDCYDPETNIGIGARYFKTVLDQNSGNVAAAMGNYNGWYFGLTTFLANNYSTCSQHNNLDYLQNVFNGYLQGVDPSSLNMGIYHNTCH